MQTRFFNTTRPANPSAAISPRLLDALVLLVLGLNYYYVRLLVALMPDVEDVCPTSTSWSTAQPACDASHLTRLAHCLFSPGLATHVGLLSLAALLLVAMCAPHAWYSQNRRMVVSGVLLARSAVAVLMPKGGQLLLMLRWLGAELVVFGAVLALTPCLAAAASAAVTAAASTARHARKLCKSSSRAGGPAASQQHMGRTLLAAPHSMSHEQQPHHHATAPAVPKPKAGAAGMQNQCLLAQLIIEAAKAMPGPRSCLYRSSLHHHQPHAKHTLLPQCIACAPRTPHVTGRAASTPNQGVNFHVELTPAAAKAGTGFLSAPALPSHTATPTLPRASGVEEGRSTSPSPAASHS